MSQPAPPTRCLWVRNAAPDYLAGDVERLLQDAGIVRHRGKIDTTSQNAQRACALVEGYGSLAAWLWRFEPDPAHRRWTRQSAGP